MSATIATDELGTEMCGSSTLRKWARPARPGPRIPAWTPQATPRPLLIGPEPAATNLTVEMVRTNR
jgi:hypothetical protein